MKKMMALLLACLMAVSCLCLTGCSNNDGGSSDTWNISYWIPKTDDSSYYAEYEENPIVQYISANYEFNGKKLNFDFFAAPAGSEQDDFNNMIATGDYCDVMDLSMSSMKAAELYEDGIIWDLTELMEEHMPNYCAFLEANPDVSDEIYTIVDGEKKVLSLFTMKTLQDDPFEGYCYRRDWIAKYGTNPVTGEAFTYGYSDPEDYESWYDDVVFPSGYTEPIYISDWEWMFEIFEVAMADLGITDGYCMSMYYVGYLATGDFSSGFGGGGMGYYTDGTTIYNGYTSDTARAYIQCMRTWYEKGWLDQYFAEHAQDMFYSVDVESVYQGKVGAWQGRPSALGSQLDDGSAYTDGIMVYGAKLPINDVYGGEAQQNVEPNAYFRTTKVGSPTALSTKMPEEEVIAFLEFVDFLYTKEGADLRNYGLNQEQYEAFGSELYDRLGINGGNYTVDEDGTVHTFFISSDPSSIAVIMGRCIGLIDNEMLDLGYDVYVAAGEAAWGYYSNSAVIPDSVYNAVPVENQQQITKMQASLDQFLARTVPAMIMGEGYDVFDDAQWESFVSTVNKYGIEKIVGYYQEALDLLNQ